MGPPLICNEYGISVCCAKYNTRTVYNKDRKYETYRNGREMGFWRQKHIGRGEMKMFLPLALNSILARRYSGTFHFSSAYTSAVIVALFFRPRG